MDPSNLVADRREIGSTLRRAERSAAADRRDSPAGEYEAGCGGRRSRALLMLAPVFGLGIWGVLIALAV